MLSKPLSVCSTYLLCQQEKYHKTSIRAFLICVLRIKILAVIFSSSCVPVFCCILRACAAPLRLGGGRERAPEPRTRLLPRRPHARHHARPASEVTTRTGTAACPPSSRAHDTKPVCRSACSSRDLSRPCTCVGWCLSSRCTCTSLSPWDVFSILATAPVARSQFNGS